MKVEITPPAERTVTIEITEREADILGRILYCIGGDHNLRGLADKLNSLALKDSGVRLKKNGIGALMTYDAVSEW